MARRRETRRPRARAAGVARCARSRGNRAGTGRAGPSLPPVSRTQDRWPGPCGPAPRASLDLLDKAAGTAAGIGETKLTVEGVRVGARPEAGDLDQQAAPFAGQPVGGTKQRAPGSATALARLHDQALDAQPAASALQVRDRVQR